MSHTILSQSHRRLITLLLSGGVAVLLLAGAGALYTTAAFAASSTPLTGYAWSSNIGWVSFNCKNTNSCATSNYSVNINPNGNLTGYAWSSNIGWISFNETSGCPEAGCTTQPKLNASSGVVSGWAKVIAANNNGWDGWIKLGGPWSQSVKFSSSAAIGYSWGSDVVGWLSWGGKTWKGVSIVAPTATLTAKPSIIDKGKSTNISWSSTNASYCTETQGSSSKRVATLGTITTVPLTANTLYQLTCTGPGGRVSLKASALVTVRIPTLSLNAAPTRVSKGGLVTLSWNATNVKYCYITKNGTPVSWGKKLLANAQRVVSGTATDPVTAQAIYKLTCVNNAGLSAAVSTTQIVNVAQTFRVF